MQMMNCLQKLPYVCDAILFVSRLIQKCFRRKFIHIFEDVWSLHICFCAYLFRLRWIMHANFRDVFLRQLVFRTVFLLMLIFLSLMCFIYLTFQSLLHQLLVLLLPCYVFCLDVRHADTWFIWPRGMEGWVYLGVGYILRWFTCL